FSGNNPEFVVADLSKGGKIQIPAGTETTGLKVNGTDVAKSDQVIEYNKDSFKDGKVKLEGKLPAGTVIVGKYITFSVPEKVAKAA
ncbi:MAG: hypothetical protein ABIH78_01435, partial [Candidatus Peregrinibacteria bacterium]